MDRNRVGSSDCCCGCCCRGCCCCGCAAPVADDDDDAAAATKEEESTDATPPASSIPPPKRPRPRRRLPSYNDDRGSEAPGGPIGGDGGLAPLARSWSSSWSWWRSSRRKKASDRDTNEGITVISKLVGLSDIDIDEDEDDVNSAMVLW